MKTNGTRIILIRGILLLLLSLYFIVVFGQSSNIVFFNASRKSENIALQWVLAPSNNLSTVIIERKSIDTAFRSIAEFWVNFDGNTEHNFRYTDKKVKSKTVQYRLKCITTDGQIQYSNIVSSADAGERKITAKPAAAKIKNHNPVEKRLLANSKAIASEKNIEQLKYLLLVQLQEREKNLL
jgi:hypothetical protein